MDAVLRLDEVDRTKVAVVGGKGANLGELSRIDGIDVPPGFCVTTDAFRRFMADAPSMHERLDELSRLSGDDLADIRERSAEIRRAVAASEMPDDVAAAIVCAVGELGEGAPCAVRSSATVEDLATASFAGQHDTYLNVAGPAAILQHVSRCWASLFTERAVSYRLRNHVDHRTVHMAVVVQQMVLPDAAGVLFTADPVTGNRKVGVVEGGFGLGEGLVAGLVTADVFRVRDDRVISTTLASERQEPALTDEQAVRLVSLGRRIEAHFGQPQDIEWCRVGDEFRIVQSRPITTLFPLPALDDNKNHVYISVGHQQMMTDPMKPLGISMWQLSAIPPMHVAGGRLFVDAAPRLASPATRAALVEVMRRGDPLIGDALETILERGLIPMAEDAPPPPAILGGDTAPIETDPGIVTGLIEEAEESIAAASRDIETKSGPELLDFILEDIQELRRVLHNPRSGQAIRAGMEATWWLNDHLQEWLGEKNAADTLTQSVPHNITSEMGLALLDVADAIRPHSEVVTFLHRVEDDGFLDRLPGLEGGAEARAVIERYLDRYGMRCVGEIDITRPRWRERPRTLVPVILANVENFEPGEARRRFERGQQEAEAKAQDVLARLRALPGGAAKADEAKRMIDRVRTFSGYREYPKYGLVSRYFVYKQALGREADRLVASGVLREREDVFYLTLQELHEVVRTRRVDAGLVAERKEAFVSYLALTPPRVLTSEGEAVTGSYRRHDVPVGALVGLAVSAGTSEGRARVVRNMGDAELGAGDILVTAYTDPSWSPLFVTAGAMVTEVGGLMTHGAVIAREYGLPAVVGVEGATRLIQDGQRIRVHGTEGYVELLS